LDDQGNTIETSRTSGEPATFEIGAGDIVGNELFEAFDEAVRGLTVGETIGIKADGPAWTEELLFNVPVDHPEIERMNGRYKNQGGVHEGLIAELSNGGMAVVVKVDEDNDVVQLDANSMMAGKTLIFELELLDISRE
jgi:FKBP-type peptidyl-prolyl cis-trans isomerase 2